MRLVIKKHNNRDKNYVHVGRNCVMQLHPYAGTSITIENNSNDILAVKVVY